MADQLDADTLGGLSSAEVAQRQAAGQLNTNTDVKTKSITQILAEHTFTLFNAVMVVLALLVLLTGQPRNVLFMGTVVANLAIGCFQEIRSKRAIDKLSLIAERDVEVIRDRRDVHIPSEQIVLGDFVRIGRGDQVPADGVVVAGSATLDESLLTGESDRVSKTVGDELMSGSFVSSGAVVVRVIRVGADSYAARLNIEAKVARKAHSDIVSSINGVIRVATFVMVPLGLGLFVRTFAASHVWQTATLSTVSALVGMIPQGLILLTSTVFAIAATRLAQHSVLVQQLYCVEALARVDVLCLDKTGTITTGKMEVEQLSALDGVSEAELASILATIVHAEEHAGNETSSAIAAYVDARGVLPSSVSRSVSFSSSTKYSGCIDVSGRAFVMGAAQFVLQDRYSEVAERICSFGELARVLVVATCDGFDEEGRLQGTPQALGFVVIRDEIRPTAADTVRYFCKQGVTLCVISGDDPRTVSGIAASVGIPSASAWVDASTLTTHQELIEASRNYRVFGRVTPEQKRDLVRALRADGHTVAMTGDGVNDVLALREADCSVAMASGSDAARNVSELVLVDNDFAHMPEVVAEGRRSINNLQRSASLFLVKTVFSAALALICVLWPPYPFLPVQMTLLSTAVIGVPSFLLALEPNTERVRGDFLTHVLGRSLPASLAITLCLASTIVVSRLLRWSTEQMSTISMYLVFAVGLALIIQISRPLTPLRRGVVAISAAIFLGGSLIFGPFFEVASLEAAMWLFLAASSIAGIALFVHVYNKWANTDDECGIAARSARMVGGSHGREDASGGHPKGA